MALWNDCLQGTVSWQIVCSFLYDAVGPSVAISGKVMALALASVSQH